ncbi:MAG: 4-(cytidine 5'-diphospho)-2-C-methyl-D-erythritol kinase [Sulfitobacter litoralis]|uniref:4-diphosphocytidyl-2-C-methyl-D-erythritol kinase n=1 Tax=Sulfitobacter litoralis TaxID=335975 RepID=A0ABY0RQM4_9RHOB|nr:4-(cytidine 5'-diphospho)-2-C-methyl-D-erythritol kinase [Sulfitobacter litoralis]SDO37935.1 4-diphosphocytidyl-2-C-methyl-D-erythritol kinase [Sulfitobacter litoralis]
MTAKAASLGVASNRSAWAKVNLTLHVTGQRSDGYHLLDSLVVRAGVGDQIAVTPSDQLELFIDGPYGSAAPNDDRNLVVRAARLLDAGAGRGARLHLTKNLPAAAGIGGGSADAAATLHLLSAHWGLPVPDDIARLGADVPVCLSDIPQRMQGIGEVLTPAPKLPPCWLVLINPNKSAATPEVFSRLEARANAPMPKELPEFTSATAFAAWLATQRNDLEAPAVQVVPEVATCLQSLQDALLARMSGSGATCFGLYETQAFAQRAAARVADKHPGWWVVAAPVLG